MRGRFAPSTTGRAHPGTLLAAMLCWLDARSVGGEVGLRLENLDRERTKPDFETGLVEDFSWLGLDWDFTLHQTHSLPSYERRTDSLAAQGLVFACSCSRANIRETARRAPDGSFHYPGTCRDAAVGAEAWRSIDLPLRLRMDSVRVDLRDESGLDLSGDPAQLFGDPILRRRDGAFAYHFASVVDDADSGIDRIIRGRDLAPSTTLQAGIRAILDFTNPVYRHHALLMESDEGKFSKMHGAVDSTELFRLYDAPALCGFLASCVGLVASGTRCRPADLVSDFSWDRVSDEDAALRWSSEDGLKRVDSRRGVVEI